MSLGMKSIAPNIPTMAQTWNMVFTDETLAAIGIERDKSEELSGAKA